jgi:hypothetical protein
MDIPAGYIVATPIRTTVMLTLTRVARYLAKKKKKKSHMILSLVRQKKTRIFPQADNKDFDRPDNPQDISDKKTFLK